MRVWTQHKIRKKKHKRKKKERLCLRNDKNNQKPQVGIALRTCITTTSHVAANVFKSSKKLWLLNNKFCQCSLDIPFNIYKENIILFNAIYFIWNLTIYTIILVTIIFIVVGIDIALIIFILLLLFSLFCLFYYLCLICK